MDAVDTIVIALAVVLVILLLVVRFMVRAIARLRSELAQLQTRKHSDATRHGQTIEQFAPLVSSWPWDPKEFRFLGSPIDGIQFTDDGVIIVEIKTGTSTLNARQRKIRALVESGKVSWAEIRL